MRSNELLISQQNWQHNDPEGNQNWKEGRWRSSVEELPGLAGIEPSSALFSDSKMAALDDKWWSGSTEKSCS